MEAQPEIFQYFDYGVLAGVLLISGGILWRITTVIGRTVNEQFVRPLGGKDGIVATFFITQTHCLHKLTESSERLTESSEKSVELEAEHNVVAKQFRDDHAAHSKSTEAFQAKTSVELQDLFYCHGQLAFIATCDDPVRAKEAAENVDRVVNKYLA